MKEVYLPKETLANAMTWAVARFGEITRQEKIMETTTLLQFARDVSVIVTEGVEDQDMLSVCTTSDRFDSDRSLAADLHQFTGGRVIFDDGTINPYTWLCLDQDGTRAITWSDEKE